jgi:uncharacterized protein YdhG (YjbR/CyaY superfamily)
VGTPIRKRTFRNGDGPEGVDAYLSHFSPPVRTFLNKLRKTIKSAAPMAKEVISYSMPGYRFNGPPVFFAAHDKHCGFYGVSGSALEAFEKELKPFRTSSTTLHFWVDKPLPENLVKAIVRRRVKENAVRAMQKKGPRTSPRTIR